MKISFLLFHPQAKGNFCAPFFSLSLSLSLPLIFWGEKKKVCPRELYRWKALKRRREQIEEAQARALAKTYRRETFSSVASDSFSQSQNLSVFVLPWSLRYICPKSHTSLFSTLWWNTSARLNRWRQFHPRYPTMVDPFSSFLSLSLYCFVVLSEFSTRSVRVWWWFFFCKWRRLVVVNFFWDFSPFPDALLSDCAWAFVGGVKKFWELLSQQMLKSSSLEKNHVNAKKFLTSFENDPNSA